MHGTTYGRQRLDIVRRTGQQCLLITNGGQHFIGFFEEDRQQFRVDGLVGSIRQLQGFGRGCFERLRRQAR
jgi:hypothetical protein